MAARVATVLRSIGLASLAVAFAVLAPLSTLADRLIQGLTSEAPYARLVEDLGIAEEISEAVSGIDGLLPEGVARYLADPEAPLAGARRELGLAVERAIADLTSQIPSWVAGRRDHLEAALDLRAVRDAAISSVAGAIPGGGWAEPYLRRAAEAEIPDRVEIERPARALEALLSPVRAAVTALSSLVDAAGRAALLAIAAIVLLAFRLSRAALWSGAALAAAGAIGAALATASSRIAEIALPDAIAGSRAFEDLFAASVRDARLLGLWRAGAGACLIALALAAPRLARALGGRKRCGIGPVLAAMSRPGGTALPDLLAAPISIAAYLASSKRGARRAARAALGGRAAAAAALDAALPALAMHVLVGGGGPLGRLLVIPTWLAFFLFWALRDRPRSGGGINLVDALAGVRRVRSPGKDAPAASLVRALPLCAAMIAAGLHPPVLLHAFGAAAAVEVAALAVAWPDRTAGDLLAGTRARLRRGTVRRGQARIEAPVTAG